MGVQILDCTLRDGGYVNNWEFGRHAIASILDKLAAGGVEIVECGFLSNYEEAALLNTDEYQDRLAWTIHMGIMEYLNQR